MGKYRSKLQIIADILSVASKGAKKTWIMYQANLSYALLNRYLTEVMDAGLVSFVGSGDCYKITRKGQEFLDKFSGYFERRRRLEEQINDMNSEKMDLEKMIEEKMIDSRITE
jgi:predicted transcriptional regulator